MIYMRAGLGCDMLGSKVADRRNGRWMEGVRADDDVAYDTRSRAGMSARSDHPRGSGVRGMVHV